MAAVNIEQYNDEGQTITGQVRATKEPGESLCAMLPPRHLEKDRRQSLMSGDAFE